MLLGLENLFPYISLVTKGDLKVNDSLYEECEPSNIIKDLDLLNKCYVDTAKYGHFIDYNKIV